jgi:hypothetical protein
LRSRESTEWETGFPKIAAFVLLCLFLSATVMAGLRDFASANSRGMRARSITTIDFSDPRLDQGELTVESTKIAPALLQRVSAEEAMKVNLERPPTGQPIAAASPFVLGRANLLNRMRAVDCLAAAVYFEAANEPYEGQTAVAQVVLNRLRLPLYPGSVCEVVFEGSHLRTGCQFSFTCDGSMRRVPSTVGWQRARAVAEAALSGQVNSKVGWATHYHADYVVPYWAPKLVKLKSIGRHIFYGWPRYWNRPTAFMQTYAGAERGLPRGPGQGVTDGRFQGFDGNLSAPLTITRAIPMNERPVIFGGLAKPSDADSAASKALENRWVLVAPASADQVEAPTLPL